MPVAVIISFVVVFALVLLAVSVAMKFFEAKRKQQVSDMLQTAAGDANVTVSTLLKEVEPERSTGLKGLLAPFEFSRRAQSEIRQAGLDWSSSRLLGAMALMAVPGLGVGALAPVLLNGPVTALVLGLIFAALPYLYVRRKRSKRLDKLEEQFPEALDFLARSMRAGHAFTISMEMLGEELADPLGQEFRTLFNEQNLGAPLDMALRNFADRVPLLDARFFTSSVLLQKQTGGNLAEILSRLAYVIRERFRLKGQVKAASAHGRLTASILTILPVATMVGLLMVAPGYLQSMAADPDGKWMIGGAIGAQILGNFFIKKIINIKV
ncbi:MAG: type II secretion system F family protein [Acidobacteriia bacterium]|nr:type II secretion system F family protein [Terriglobia bacterium]